MRLGVGTSEAPKGRGRKKRGIGGKKNRNLCLSLERKGGKEKG